MDLTAVIILIASTVLVLVTCRTYERLLEQARHERDEAIADADLATELFMESIHRHPSGSNVRVLRSVDGGAS